MPKAEQFFSVFSVFNLFHYAFLKRKTLVALNYMYTTSDCHFYKVTVILRANRLNLAFSCHTVVLPLHHKLQELSTALAKINLEYITSGL